MASNALNQVALAHGRLSDYRAVWWPFVFLKPAIPAVPISIYRIFLMTPCFAGWFVVVWLLKEWLFNNAEIPPATDILKAYCYFLVGFFIWFNVVTAPLWNRRSKILSRPHPHADGFK